MNTYTENKFLENIIQDAVRSVEAGNPTDLDKMIKAEPTLILKASPQHKEKRFQPGNKLVTYNGIDEKGNPVQETWGGGVAEIGNDSVILRNRNPLTYPTGHELEGQKVQGYFNEDGVFQVAQDVQNKEVEDLFNEYVSDVDFVRNAYGVEPQESWQEGLKLEPSYALRIPSEIEEVTIHTKNADITLHGNDYTIIDTKKGKVTSVHGCEKKWFENTYKDFDGHVRGLSENGK